MLHVTSAHVFLFGTAEIFLCLPNSLHASLFERPEKGGFNKGFLM